MTGATLGERPEALDLEPSGMVSCQAPRPRSRQRRLSHELGTPLNAILGNVELMLDGSTGPLTGEARECLAEIQSAGHDLLRQSRMVLLLIQALEASELQLERPAPLGQMFK
ncbi:MAG: histidine kinase dimerization/phospho-acceptor domain-containing protein, partial [Geminicoccaceae bacterium]|nr:histidine kinase dimerization/phospho-acceptor domain-containing protein [Geminicoccaceae bacterium]